MFSEIIGYFSDEETVRGMVKELHLLGFGTGDVSVVGPGGETETFSDGKNLWGDQVDGLYFVEGGTDTLVGTGLGAVAGAVLGAGALLVPGAGPLLAAGPIALSLAGAATGGIVGALSGLGIPEDRSQYFAEKVENGNFLVVVKVGEDKLEEVSSLLKNRGAQEVEIHSLEEGTEGKN